MKQLLLWLRIIRPQTLFASLCPVCIGLLMVHKNGLPLQAGIAILTMVCALSLQILSNLINDLYDYRRGADKAGRRGFKRALAEGEVTERQMTIACLIVLSVAVMLGGCLVFKGGWAILAIGLTAILFAWLYTATPHSLSYLGIADIFVYLYYGVIAAMGTIWLQMDWVDGLFQTDCWTSQLFHLSDTELQVLKDGFWSGSVCGLISMNVLMINNIRDIDDDRQAGKRTIPVRFGKAISEKLMAAIMCLAVLCNWMVLGSHLCFSLALLLISLWVDVHRAEGKKYNQCLLFTGIVNFAYVLLVCIYC